MDPSGLDKAALIVSSITAVLFLLVLFAQGLATYYTGRAANAAKAAAEEAKRSNDRNSKEMRLRLRPWIYITAPTLERVEDQSGNLLGTGDPRTGNVQLPPGTSGDSAVIYSLPITNYGAYPGSAVGIFTKYAFVRSEAEEYVQRQMGPRNAVISPSQEFSHRVNIRYDDCKKCWNLPTHPLFLACGVVFYDMDRNAWATEATFMIEGTRIETIYDTPPTPFQVKPG